MHEDVERLVGLDCAKALSYVNEFTEEEDHYNFEDDTQREECTSREECREECREVQLKKRR